MDYEPGEFLVVVKWLAEKYTGKNSSSITYETAAQLTEAVVYCLEECETGDNRGERRWVLDGGNRLEVKTSYEEGYCRVMDRVQRARKLYNAMAEEFKDYGSITWRDTVVKGMPEFFKRYDPRLNPQDHILLLDYPVLRDVSGLSGIRRIDMYLECTRLEQEFLARFTEDYVRKCLRSYHSEYEFLPVNFTLIILRKLLCGMLLGSREEMEEISAEGYERLKAVVGNLCRRELELGLEHFLARFTEEGWKEEPEEGKRLYEYLALGIPDIAVELQQGAFHDVLSNLV